MTEASCIYTIKTKYHKLSGKERMIADYILANPKESVHPSVEELSDIIGISQSTLVRFVKKIGYSGYQRFRIALATETIENSYRLFETPVHDQDDKGEVVFNSAMSAHELTKNRLSL